MTYLHDIMAGLRAPKLSRLGDSVDQLIVQDDGPGPDGARRVERMACGIAAAFLLLAGCLWVMPAVLPGSMNILAAVGLSTILLGAAWPLARIGILGLRRETVLDLVLHEFRQTRISARGRVFVALSVSLSAVTSVYIQRAAPGKRSALMARLADGRRVRIGVGNLATLGRLHHEISVTLRDHANMMPIRPSGTFAGRRAGAGRRAA